MENKVEIKWTSRYSETMDDDDMGRWARVAYAGKLDGMGFHYNKVARFEIAWISKIKDGKLTGLAKDKKFMVRYHFPNSKGADLFETLSEAKKETEKQFRWFIKMVTQKQTL